MLPPRGNRGGRGVGASGFLQLGRPAARAMWGTRTTGLRAWPDNANPLRRQSHRKKGPAGTVFSWVLREDAMWVNTGIDRAVRMKPRSRERLNHFEWSRDHA